MSKTLDFDKFLSEKNKETLDVTVFGKVYRVPLMIPAIVPVMMARSEENLDQNESTKMVYRAADALFGEDAVNEMCAKGMAGKDMAELVQSVFNIINGKEEEDDEAQELSDEDSHVAAPRRGKTAKK